MSWSPNYVKKNQKDAEDKDCSNISTGTDTLIIPIGGDSTNLSTTRI